MNTQLKKIQNMVLSSITKLKRYWDLAHQLIAQKAYLAFDSPEEIQLQKQEQEKGIFSFRYDRNWLKISQQEKAKAL